MKLIFIFWQFLLAWIWSKFCLYYPVVARGYYKKKYVCYLLNKRETGYQFIMVPSNFTRNCINFSLFVYKRICVICTHHVERCGPITGLGAVLAATECTDIIFITEICHKYKIQRRFQHYPCRHTCISIGLTRIILLFIWQSSIFFYISCRSLRPDKRVPRVVYRGRPPILYNICE